MKIIKNSFKTGSNKKIRKINKNKIFKKKEKIN